jgi:SAM-dependent methyltransferase
VGTCVDGIPCFADPDYYWGEIPRASMQDANRLARDIGWQAAVERVVSRKTIRDYISAPWRADFQKVWTLPPNSSILDIGAGWGGVAACLATRFSRVVAVEGVLERTRFIDTRSRQMNLPIEAICADFLRLPLAPQQFDAVVLNGVLEWVGTAKPVGDPRDLQIAFLRSVRELLKPSGFVCVGIENRIGRDALLGGADHSGVPYTSLMPRKIASIVCGLFVKRYCSDANVGYRTYTYSLPGYHKLFREAGYGTVRAFHAWNGYNEPTILLPLDKPEALLRFVDSQGWELSGLLGRAKRLTYRVGALTSLWRNLASEFIFLVAKG